jgi:hypothetical protein
MAKPAAPSAGWVERQQGGRKMSSPADSFISLRCLYAFAKHHQREYEEALNPKEDLGKQYYELCNRLTKNIPEVQGIYVWGRFDGRRYWDSIYLGKAGLGKSKELLRARITEELKDERCFVWRYILSKNDLFGAGPKVHRGGQEKWDRYIHKAWERSVKKERTTHIIFAQTRVRDNDSVRKVEAELIEALKPEVNVLRPVPPKQVIKEAARIFSHFRQTIHHIRSLRRGDGGPFRIELA